jgi:dsDNA-specific endonuclease/ATPase MutS2
MQTKVRIPQNLWFTEFAVGFSVEGGIMAKLKLDLHEICSSGDRINAELNRIVKEALDKNIAIVEIIPGKGSGQLKMKVLRFLNQSHIKKLYHRVEKDGKNFGRIFIHFRF